MERKSASSIPRACQPTVRRPESSGPTLYIEIPVDGILCRGKAVEVGWPREDEFDQLTMLRNRLEVRSNFFDSRPLDIAANRAWLRSGMRRPHDALLAIRCQRTGEVCGMVGWSQWSTRTRTLELGRIAVDAKVVRARPSLREEAIFGIAYDAAIALREFLFATVGANVLRTRYFADNRLAARLNRLVGGRVVRRSTFRCSDGRDADVVELELTRDDWLGLTRASA